MCRARGACGRTRTLIPKRRCGASGMACLQGLAAIRWVCIGVGAGTSLPIRSPSMEIPGGGQMCERPLRAALRGV
jgi:hypothetical protein